MSEWFLQPPPETSAFGRLLFTVAREHLDPAGQRLQWSEGFSGSGGSGAAGGRREWGRKFGWAEDAEPGQGMIHVGVGDIPPSDRLPCGQYDLAGDGRCRRHTMPDQSRAETLQRADRLELHWPRPDGSYVFALVDAAFRNNTVTATRTALPSLQQLESFVMDRRLVLPPPDVAQSPN